MTNADDTVMTQLIMPLAVVARVKEYLALHHPEAKLQIGKSGPVGVAHAAELVEAFISGLSMACVHVLVEQVSLKLIRIVAKSDKDG